MHAMRPARLTVALGLLGLVCLVTGSRVKAGEADDGWEECPEGFEYASAWFSCSVRPDGTIRNLKVHDVLLVRELFLHGTYKPEESYDPRFFQQAATQEGPLKIRREADGKFALAKQGVLGNEKHASGARYAQRLTLSPMRLDFDYEVELLVPLSSTSKILFTLLTLPVETFASRGFRRIRGEGPASLHVFPHEYEQKSDIHAGGVTELRVVLDNGHLVFDAGENTWITLSDTRSYGGKDFRADIHTSIPWMQRPVEYAAGTRFAWSFSLLFDDQK